MTAVKNVSFVQTKVCGLICFPLRSRNQKIRGRDVDNGTLILPQLLFLEGQRLLPHPHLHSNPNPSSFSNLSTIIDYVAFISWQEAYEWSYGFL